ncbi:MAG: LL-diaminopimelate aminotransferase, partial [Bacilli bacterium]|nr:LL-diaminopimelate aminotransferase [Bacilli bacterium]
KIIVQRLWIPAVFDVFIAKERKRKEMYMLNSDIVKHVVGNIFPELETLKKNAQKLGKHVVDLGEASPQQPAPQPVVETLRAAALNAQTHQHAPFRGDPDFLESMAYWYRYRFGVDIDPYSEVHSLLGSKEGLYVLALAYMGRGDVGLIPEPGYPTYYHGIHAAGGDIYPLPLSKDNGYLPNFEQIPVEVVKRAKLLFLNYPHNPTGAMLPDDFYPKAIEFANRNHLIICYDNAFAEITYDGRHARSILEFDGAKEVAVETFTFSKLFNMSGWRLGALIGNAEIIQRFASVHSQVHSGVFPGIQLAGVAALTEVSSSGFIEDARVGYQIKRDYAMNKFAEIQWPVVSPAGTVFLWVPVPSGMNSQTFTSLLLDQYDVLVSRGTAFGPLGEGHIRISLTSSLSNVQKGIDTVCLAIQKTMESRV